MPCTGYLKRTFPHIDAETTEDVDKIYLSYIDTTLAPFFHLVGKRRQEHLHEIPVDASGIRLPPEGDRTETEPDTILYIRVVSLVIRWKPQGYSISADQALFPLFHVLWIPVFAFTDRHFPELTGN